MPIYEYQCERCGATTEVLQRIGAPPLAACEECGGAMKRLVSAPAFQFKGTGWYVTDYARKGKGDGDAKSAKAGDKGKDGAKKETAKSDGSGSAGSPSAAGKAASGPASSKKSSGAGS